MPIFFFLLQIDVPTSTFIDLKALINRTNLQSQLLYGRYIRPQLYGSNQNSKSYILHDFCQKRYILHDCFLFISTSHGPQVIIFHADNMDHKP